MALLAATVLLAAAPLVIAVAGLLFDPGPAVASGMATYLGIRLFGLPAMFANQVAIGWFLGQHRPMVPLAMMLVANGLNAVLDIVLVLHLGMGVDGVAMATVVADYAGLAIAVTFGLGAWRRLPAGRITLSRLLERRAITRFFRLSRDLLLRTTSMQVVFVGFVAMGARQGELLLAANAVLMNFFTLQSHGLDGFADAAEAMAGRAVGRRSPSELRRAVQAALVNAGLLSLLLTLVFASAGGWVIDLLTTIPELRTAAYGFLPYVAALPVVSVWAFVADGVFFGATRGREMRNSMFLAVTAFIISAAILTPLWGNHGLWIAFLIFMAARGAVLGVIYWRADRGAAFARG